mgnify:CR=1 FL=1
MYVRGSSQGNEYRRNDSTFYKGIVVDDNDGQKLMRVKVFIPEISNQPLDDWLNKNDVKFMNFPGNFEFEALTPDILEEIKKGLPWAEPAIPLIGEFGPGRYFGQQGKGTIQDGNDIENDGSAPSKPQQEEKNSDANTEVNNTTLNNPTGNNYGANSYPNAPKGVYGVPSIGAKVWVFHYGGDLNFPVYFGGRSSYNETAPIYASGQGQQGSKIPSIDYPNGSSSRGADIPPEPSGPLRFENSTFNREDLPPGLQPLYEDYIRYGDEYNVDPRFLASISILETNGGRSQAFIQGNNAMGISNRTGVNYYNAPSARGKSIRTMARSLARSDGYYRNATTIAQVGPIYAPAGAENDIRGTNSGWAANVSNIMKRDFNVPDPENLIVINRT